MLAQLLDRRLVSQLSLNKPSRFGQISQNFVPNPIASLLSNLSMATRGASGTQDGNEVVWSLKLDVLEKVAIESAGAGLRLSVQFVLRK